MRLPSRRRRDLADRLRPYIRPQEPVESMVDTDPIRMFLYRWMIETGDPVEVVAKGFDLPATLVDDLVSRRVGALSESDADMVSRRLGLSL